MVETYWLVGERIVKEEQQGSDRADYGKKILQNLSQELGKGFSTRSLRDIRKCYVTFPVWKDLAYALTKLLQPHIQMITR